MSKEQERVYYDNVLEKVINNPRYYLDNLDKIDTFRVSFLDYSGRYFKNKKKKHNLYK